MHAACSEGSGCGGSALGLLVRDRLWEEALSLVGQWGARDSPSHSALFHTLLASMAQVRLSLTLSPPPH